MTRREIINRAVIEAGLWDGEHEWTDPITGIDEREYCRVCEKERGYTDIEDSAPCPVQDHWPLEVLLDVADWMESKGNITFTWDWIYTVFEEGRFPTKDSVRTALEDAIIAAHRGGNE